ncbi:hypothetical protein BJ912DRAFT_1052643 [Pholiota molesta]|nr:hypothetical protein BJ912DRAFT_1052643 [Pholiota molesta]
MPVCSPQTAPPCRPSPQTTRRLTRRPPSTPTAAPAAPAGPAARRTGPEPGGDARPKRPPSAGRASPVTLAKPAAARPSPARYRVPLSPLSLPLSPPQSCLKRGLGASCAYPDPDSQDHQNQQTPAASSSTTVQFAPPPMYATLGAPNLSHQQYYDYNGTFTGASTSTFRPNKRPRNLTEEEAAAITRNFSRGDFYVGSSAPVRIDPRLPVRLTLGEGDHVHFTVGEALV